MSKDVEVVQLICTRILMRGDGKDTCLRHVTQYWTMQGDFVFEIDPCSKLIIDDKVKS